MSDKKGRGTCAVSDNKERGTCVVGDNKKRNTCVVNDTRRYGNQRHPGTLSDGKTCGCRLFPMCVITYGEGNATL